MSEEELLGNLDDDDDEESGSEHNDRNLQAVLNPFTVVRTTSRKRSKVAFSDTEKEEEVEPPAATVSEDQMSARFDAYESIGVVSALLAGFALSEISEVTKEELDPVHWVIEFLFVFNTSVTIALNFYSFVVSVWIYYFGSLLLGHGETQASLLYLENDKVKEYRKCSILALMLSIPTFCASLAFLFLIKLPKIYAYLSATFFIICAAYFMKLGADFLRAFHQARLDPELVNQAALEVFPGYQSFEYWFLNRTSCFFFCVGACLLYSFGPDLQNTYSINPTCEG